MNTKPMFERVKLNHRGARLKNWKLGPRMAGITPRTVDISNAQKYRVLYRLKLSGMSIDSSSALYSAMAMNATTAIPRATFPLPDRKIELAGCSRTVMISENLVLQYPRT
jgi:hypothetical protein